MQAVEIPGVKTLQPRSTYSREGHDYNSDTYQRELCLLVLLKEHQLSSYKGSHNLVNVFT